MSETEVRTLLQAIELAATTILTQTKVPDVEDAYGIIQQVVAEIERLRASEERAWVLIANAYGGDWSKGGYQWQRAAGKWRDNYHKHLPPPTGDKVEEPLGAEEKL
jgi:hypothetical protein